MARRSGRRRIGVTYERKQVAGPIPLLNFFLATNVTSSTAVFAVVGVIASGLGGGFRHVLAGLGPAVVLVAGTVIDPSK